MTLAEAVAAASSQVDEATIAATTEEDVRRHMIEDGEDPDAPLADFRPTPDVRAIRERLSMSQATFATTIGVPVATVRNWEQRRTGIAPSARTLLRIMEREPAAVLRALA